MPIETLGKQRESLMFQSEVYKKLVRDYLESEGYASRTDSYIEGHTPDMILTHISEPYNELWVECKSTTISPSDEYLKKELLRYLIGITEKGKENIIVAVFATGIENGKDFKKILSKKYGSKMIPDWLSKAISEMKTEEQETLVNIGQDDIIKFFLRLQIKIAEPEWLRTVIAERNRRNRLSTERYIEDLYARSKRLSEPINKPVELITSMVELEHPEKIHRALSKFKTKKEVYKYFEDLKINEPPFTYFPDKQQISTFCPFDENNPLTQVIDKSTIIILSVDKDEIAQQNIHSILNIHLRRIFWKKGLLRVPDKYIYYFPANEEEDQILNKEIEGEPEKLKTVVHVYRRDNGSIDHVFHHAVEMLPQRLWGKTFLKIRPTKVFTLDGKIPLEGQRKRSKEEKYRNPLFNRNPSQLLETTFWHAFISRTDNYQKEKEYWFDNIKFGALLTTMSPYSPRIQIDTDQTKLGEFAK